VARKTILEAEGIGLRVGETILVPIREPFELRGGDEIGQRPDRAGQVLTTGKAK